MAHRTILFTKIQIYLYPRGMKDPSDCKMLGTQASLPIWFYFVMYFPKIFRFDTVNKMSKEI